eukprot:jgi/Psemu1/328942/estExt_fgenesh1_pg.C_34150001
MEVHLQRRYKAIEREDDANSNNNNNNRNRNNNLRPTIAPQTRWYYVPSLSLPEPKSATQTQPIMESCLELDGYVTSLDGDDEHDQNNDSDGGTSDYDDDECECEHDLVLDAAGKCLQCRNVHNDHVYGYGFGFRRGTTRMCTTLAGYLLKRSRRDPHVWKRHYCVLTEDDFCIRVF